MQNKTYKPTGFTKVSKHDENRMPVGPGFLAMAHKMAFEVAVKGKQLDDILFHGQCALVFARAHSDVGMVNYINSELQKVRRDLEG